MAVEVGAEVAFAVTLLAAAFVVWLLVEEAVELPVEVLLVLVFDAEAEVAFLALAPAMLVDDLQLWGQRLEPGERASAMGPEAAPVMPEQVA